MSRPSAPSRNLWPLVTLRRLILLAIAAALVALGVPAHAAAAVDVHVVRLPTLGGCCSAANAINNNGDIVGQASIDSVENPRYHAVLWRHGEIRDLGTLGGSRSYATAINNLGHVAGYSELADGSTTHAFLWRDGHMIDLGALGGASLALGINDRDEVVGITVQAGTAVGFLWRNGTMMNLVTSSGSRLAAGDAVNNNGRIAGAADIGIGFNMPGYWQNGVVTTVDSRFGEATAVNANGDLAGFFFDQTQQAFIWQTGVFRPLLTPAGASVAVATGLNAGRDVVGFASVTRTRPVLWSGAQQPHYLPVLVAGGQGAAAGINADGTIVGWSTGSNGTQRAVFWTQ
jgi:probable HAF family extracellular repeat protein